MARESRYPSDTSDEQWALIEPLLPEARTGGRPEKHPRRAVVDADGRLGAPTHHAAPEIREPSAGVVQPALQGPAREAEPAGDVVDGGT